MLRAILVVNQILGSDADISFRLSNIPDVIEVRVRKGIYWTQIALPIRGGFGGQEAYIDQGALLDQVAGMCLKIKEEIAQNQMRPVEHRNTTLP